MSSDIAHPTRLGVFLFNQAKTLKETFIIRTEWFDSILELQPEEQAIFFQNLYYFHSDNKPKINLNNLSVKLVWKLIEPNLIRNIDKYDKRSETSKQNGSLGGRPPKNKENGEEENLNKPNILPNKPIETLSVSVPDNETDIKNTISKFNFKKSLLDLGIKENLVNDWMIVREKLKAINTETSFLKIKNQLLKITDGDINSGIEMAIENSWKGFEYSWYLNKKNNLFKNETDKRNIGNEAKTRIATDFTKHF